MDRNDLSPRDIAEEFRDHCLANGKTYKDWDAAWRTWYRRAPKYTQRPRGAPVAYKPKEPCNRVEIKPGTPEWEAWKEHDKPLKHFERSGQTGQQDWWEGTRVLKPTQFPDKERVA